jgi:hypothetical protein
MRDACAAREVSRTMAERNIPRARKKNRSKSEIMVLLAFYPELMG